MSHMPSALPCTHTGVKHSGEMVATSPRCRNADSLHAMPGPALQLQPSIVPGCPGTGILHTHQPEPCTCQDRAGDHCGCAMASRERREGLRWHCHTLSHHSPLQLLQHLPPSSTGVPRSCCRLPVPWTEPVCPTCCSGLGEGAARLTPPAWFHMITFSFYL